MKRTSHKRNVTAADQAAAARLKAMWNSMPKAARPTQEAMAQRLGGSSQSLTSQYLNGKISLNYKAVLAFADVIDCEPEQIRDDLPEQLMAKAATRSQSLQQEISKLVARRDGLGLSNADVLARMLAMDWPDGIDPPSLVTVTEWFEGKRRPVDMTYRAMLYRALEMGGGNDVPIIEGVATTEMGAQLLRLAETGSPDEAAQILALWTTMRKARERDP